MEMNSAATVIDTMLRRRSVRSYKADPVPDAILEDVLRTGMNAPSAANQQPWHFVVIKDRNVLDSITAFHPYAAALKSAPVAIVVCGKPEGQFKEWWPQDCSAAVQNMLLAATAHGLGSLWIGIHSDPGREKNLGALIRVPSGVLPFAIVALGYSEKPAAKADRFDKTRIHMETW